MQQIFAKAWTEPAARQGLLDDAQNLDVSVNGTCILSGGSGWGSKKRIFWWILVHSVNILLDAAQKLSKTTCLDILTQSISA